jgi:molecular chaperone GrpE (heat shock protein)
MFVQQFDSILSDMSISKIDVKIGDEYNSDIMNASETIEDFNANDNTVAKVFNSAYKLHDRIIKHAGVVVVKNSKLN